MKHTKLLVALVVLLAAGLGMACDQGLPTQIDYGSENWHMPHPCPLGTPPQYAHGCIPQGPSGGPYAPPPA